MGWYIRLKTVLLWHIIIESHPGRNQETAGLDEHRQDLNHSWAIVLPSPEGTFFQEGALCFIMFLSLYSLLTYSSIYDKLLEPEVKTDGKSEI
jgi:hypothetical protein